MIELTLAICALLGGECKSILVPRSYGSLEACELDTEQIIAATADDLTDAGYFVLGSTCSVSPDQD